MACVHNNVIFIFVCKCTCVYTWVYAYTFISVFRFKKRHFPFHIFLNSISWALSETFSVSDTNVIINYENTMSNDKVINCKMINTIIQKLYDKYSTTVLITKKCIII